MMATVRIADAVHHSDESRRTRSQDDSRSCTGVGISRTEFIAPSNLSRNDDNIYNIRACPRPERIGGRSEVPEQADDEISLERPSDYKEKQVCKAAGKTDVQTC